MGGIFFICILMLIFLWPIKISAIAYVGANMVLPEIQYSELVYPF